MQYIYIIKKKAKSCVSLHWSLAWLHTHVPMQLKQRERVMQWSVGMPPLRSVDLERTLYVPTFKNNLVAIFCLLKTAPFSSPFWNIHSFMIQLACALTFLVVQQHPPCGKYQVRCDANLKSVDPSCVSSECASWKGCNRPPLSANILCGFDM